MAVSVTVSFVAIFLCQQRNVFYSFRSHLRFRCVEIIKVDSCLTENNYCDHELRNIFGIIESKDINMERFLCLGNSNLYERKLVGKT